MGAPKTHNRFTAPTSLPTGQARFSSNRCLTMNRRAYSALAEEEILGLKPRTPRGPRLDSKQQLSQKRDHRPLHYHTPTRASSRIRFSGGTTLRDEFAPDDLGFDLDRVHELDDVSD